MKNDEAGAGDGKRNKLREHGRRNLRIHDNQSIYVSLKQWRILHAVIDFGGVTEAAEHLHLSQSAVSYTIAKMQEQLGVQLLQVVGRRARLTEAGKEVLDRSRHILKKAIELEMLARQFVEGQKPVLNIAVDAMFPSNLLMKALQAYSRVAPTVTVRVSEIGNRYEDELLDTLSVDLAIGPSVPEGHHGEPLMEVDYVAVVHPNHPLARLGPCVTQAELERHVRIGSAPPASRSERGGKPGLSCHWSVNNPNLVIEAVCEGLGYAWLPRHLVLRYLERGTLVSIPLGERYQYKRTLYLLYRRPLAPDTPVAGLSDILKREASKEQHARYGSTETMTHDAPAKYVGASSFVMGRIPSL